MLKEYPLTDSDLAQIGRRMADGESCYIPVRRDRVLKNGEVEECCLIWRHPAVYRIKRLITQCGEVLYYGRPIELEEEQ